MSRHGNAHAKIGSFGIEFDNDCYHAGDVIEGYAKLTVVREILVRNVCVQFYGEVAYRDPDETPRSRRLWLRACDLWRGVPDCYLPPGNYSYRFSLATPVSLPTAFESPSDSLLHLPSTSTSPIISSLKYYCEVRVSETITEHVKRREIRMEGVCLDWPDSRSDANVAREVGYVRNLLDASGTIGATLKLNRGWALPGSSVYCNVEVLNCFRKLHVELRLLEKFIVIAKGAPFTVRDDEELIYVRHLGSVKSSDAYRRWLGVDCWIPDDGAVPFREKQRESLRSIGSTTAMVKRISKGAYLQLRVKGGVLSNTLSIALPICIIADARYLPRRLPNGTLLSGAATI